MSNMPEIIWLQWYGEDDLPHDAETWKPDMADVTWAQNQINATDPEYIRADVAHQRLINHDALRQSVVDMADEIERLKAENEAALNLLAVMHCDGGHHSCDVGFVKACKDAEEVRHALVLALDNAMAEIERLKKALEQAIEFWLIEMSQIDVTTRETGEPFCPELAAYLKEKS